MVIDTPPLATCSDGAAVAALGDGAIVLARIGHTKTKPLRDALRALEAANAGLLGTVVTCEPGHRREPSQPAEVADPSIVSPKPTINNATINSAETIDEAEAHRVSGVKREGR